MPVPKKHALILLAMHEQPLRKLVRRPERHQPGFFIRSHFIAQSAVTLSQKLVVQQG